MRIIHFALSSFYVDNYQYQENILSSQNKKDGHEVLIIASIDSFDNRYKSIQLSPGKYVNEDGVQIIRVPYRWICFNKLLRKFRLYRGVYDEIQRFQPDILFFHGIGSYEIRTIAHYKKKYPYIKFYVDTHADDNNSATNLLSKLVLHRFFYRFCFKTVERYIDKLFYITAETRDFALRLYNVNPMIMDYLPLGGYLIQDDFYLSIRNKIRSTLKLSENDIVFLTSGKFGPHKRIDELIMAFNEAFDTHIRLLVVGQFYPATEEIISPLLAKSRNIDYIGWKSSVELNNFLCAADVYIQLAGQTVTMQNALCNRCAVALYPYKSHLELLEDAPFYIESKQDIKNLITLLLNNKHVLEKKREKCWDIAVNKLDYSQIVRKYV